MGHHSPLVLWPFAKRTLKHRYRFVCFFNVLAQPSEASFPRPSLLSWKRNNQSCYAQLSVRSSFLLLSFFFAFALPYYGLLAAFFSATRQPLHLCLVRIRCLSVSRGVCVPDVFSCFLLFAIPFRGYANSHVSRHLALVIPSFCMSTSVRVQHSHTHTKQKKKCSAAAFTGGYSFFWEGLSYDNTSQRDRGNA